MQFGKPSRSRCFVKTKGAVVPWLGSQPLSPRAQDLSVLGFKPLTPWVDLFWSQGRSFGCSAPDRHPATGFQRVLLDHPFLVHPSIILWLILKIKINEFFGCFLQLAKLQRQNYFLEPCIYILVNHTPKFTLL